MFGLGKKKGQPAKKPAWEKPNVSASSRWLTERAKEDLRRNVEALPDIPKSERKSVYELAEVCVAKGDHASLSQALGRLDGVTPRRAAEICRLLSKKARAVTDADNQIRLGIKRSIWTFTKGVPPCSADPAVQAAHQAADGQTYDPAKGLLICGVPTWPGYDDDCRCGHRSRIPGFD